MRIGPSCRSRFATVAAALQLATGLAALTTTGCPAPAAEGEGEGEGEGDVAAGCGDLSCGPHARCDDSRTGDAECVCLAGYEGDDCAACSYGYRADGDDCALCDDADEDGELPVDCGGRDCDDADARVPNAFSEGGIGADSCFDGVDNDCNGDVDAADSECATPCTADGWCLVREAFSGGLFEGTFMFAADDAWVAGESFIGTQGEVGGVIHHWDGRRFTTFEFSGHNRIQLVYGVAPDDVWATGSGTELFHWDGTGAWEDRASTLPDGEAPYALWGAAADDIWGLTFDFGMLHWNGATWTRVKDDVVDPNGFFVPQPSSITGCAADDIWMPEGRSLIRFDGASTLTEYSSGADVLPSSSTVSFAAGVAGGDVAGGAQQLFVAGGPLLRSNGAALERTIPIDDAAAAQPVDIRAVAASAVDAWAAGDGGAVWKWNAATSAWEDVSPSSSSSDWIAAHAPGDGTVLLATQGGAVFSYDGATLTSLVSDSFVRTYARIALLSATEGFAVTPNNGFGFDNSGTIYRLETFGGGSASWSSSSSDLGANDVYAVSATDAWAVADDSKVFRFDGNNWNQQFTGVLPLQAGEAYESVSGTSSSDVWIAGTATVLRYNGNAFSLVPTSVPGGFNARLFAAAADDIWLFWGTHMLHSRGGAFTDFGPTLDAFVAACDGPDALRLIGSPAQQEGAAFGRYTGAGFTTDIDDDSFRIFDAAFTPSGAFAVGFAPAGESRIAFTRGDSWIAEPPPGERQHSLNTVAADAAGDAIAAGSDGAIYVRVAP